MYCRKIYLAALMPLAAMAGAGDVAANQICSRVIQCPGPAPGGDPQVCGAGTTLRATANSLVNGVKVTAPREHCSNVRYHVTIRRDPRPARPPIPATPAVEIGRGSTPFLAPGEAAIVRMGSIDLGSITIAIQADGNRSGCNTGRLGSYRVCVEPVRR